MWKLNNIFLKRQCVKEKFTREIRKYLDTNENKTIIYQNLWDAVKAMLRGKYMAVMLTLKRKEDLKSATP